MKLTYGHFNHIPFESSWGILLKASALNLASPLQLLSGLFRTQQPSCPSQYWRACDVDDAKLATALSLPYPAIRRAFIDNLVECTPRMSPVCIRHCAKCVAVGYHSVFFFLQIIKRCPWHNELLEPCTHCSNAIVRGLVVTHALDGFSTKMRCGHFLFDSAGSVRLICATPDQRRKYAELGARIEAWLDAAGAMQDPLVNYAISSLHAAKVKGGNSDEEERLINIGLNSAVTAVGGFPAPNAINLIPSPRYEMTWATYSAHEAAGFDFSARQVFLLYRCVRRYLYSAYVRPHAACYRYLSSLSARSRHGLDCQCTCAVSAAFLAWCAALRYRFAEGEGINLVAPNWHVRPSTPRQIMALWITHFYAIWTGIEVMCAACNRDLDRFSVELSGSASLVLGAEVISVIGAGSRLSSDLTCWHACPALLSRCTDKRCGMRSRVSDQSNFRAHETVEFWCYVPEPATFLRFWYGDHIKAGRPSPFVAAG